MFFFSSIQMNISIKWQKTAHLTIGTVIGKFHLGFYTAMIHAFAHELWAWSWSFFHLVAAFNSITTQSTFFSSFEAIGVCYTNTTFPWTCGRLRIEFHSCKIWNWQRNRKKEMSILIKTNGKLVNLDGNIRFICLLSGSDPSAGRPWIAITHTIPTNINDRTIEFMIFSDFFFLTQT